MCLTICDVSFAVLPFAFWLPINHFGYHPFRAGCRDRGESRDFTKDPCLRGYPVLGIFFKDESAPCLVTVGGTLCTTLWCLCGPQKTAREFEDSVSFLTSFVKKKRGEKGTVSATIGQVKTHIVELGPYLLVGILFLFALVWWYFKNKKTSREFNPNTNMFVVGQDFTRRGDAIPRDFDNQSTDSTPKAGRMFMNPNLAAWENDDGTGHAFGSGSQVGSECYSDLEQESVVYEVERACAL
jgi:hypothetical protein